MRIRVLGASGSERPGSSLTGFLIDDKTILDPGTVTPLLTFEEQERITDVLISHSHLDHIRDLPFILDNRLMLDEVRTINVWALEETITILKEHLFNDLLWPDFTRLPVPERPVLRFQELFPGMFLKVGGYQVKSVLVNHSVPASGVIIKDDEGKGVGYTGDTGRTRRFWEEIYKEGVEHIIVEVSFPDGHHDMAGSSGHYSPRVLIEDLKRFTLHERNIYITHVKPQFQEEIEREMSGLRFVRFLRGGEVIEL